jgi:hypothetical protein
MFFTGVIKSALPELLLVYFLPIFFTSAMTNGTNKSSRKYSIRIFLVVAHQLEKARVCQEKSCAAFNKNTFTLIFLFVESFGICIFQHI